MEQQQEAVLVVLADGSARLLHTDVVSDSAPDEQRNALTAGDVLAEYPGHTIGRVPDPAKSRLDPSLPLKPGCTYYLNRTPASASCLVTAPRPPPLCLSCLEDPPLTPRSTGTGPRTCNPRTSKPPTSARIRRCWSSHQIIAEEAPEEEGLQQQQREGEEELWATNLMMPDEASRRHRANRASWDMSCNHSEHQSARVAVLGTRVVEVPGGSCNLLSPNGLSLEDLTAASPFPFPAFLPKTALAQERMKIRPIWKKHSPAAGSPARELEELGRGEDPRDIMPVHRELEVKAGRKDEAHLRQGGRQMQKHRSWDQHRSQPRWASALNGFGVHLSLALKKRSESEVHLGNKENFHFVGESLPDLQCSQDFPTCFNLEDICSPAACAPPSTASTAEDWNWNPSPALFHSTPFAHLGRK